MSEDLKIIKNKYGEKMMYLCRSLFPTILEKEGELSKILLEKFAPSKFLYDDIIEQGLVEYFRTYIYYNFNLLVKEKMINVEKTPAQLMDEAGYILYECKTEEEIQSFRKYYAPDEELCTFEGNRLDDCYVYFAVKKDVDSIKRKDFLNPERQDKYGTSVISIQFTRDESHILSIKNRYNHTVPNPDATFFNNLDYIIPGLTDSFAYHYGMKQQFKSDLFEMPGYVMANDGKYYKYNMEINNVYYCPNNIIIDNFKVKKYPKERYVIMDYFILDLKTGEINTYIEKMKMKDGFRESMKDCGRPTVYKEGEYKKIVFNKEGLEPIVIVLNKHNAIVGLENKNVKEIGDNFLYWNEKLEKLSLPNVEFIGNRCLNYNTELREVNLQKTKKIGFSFLRVNEKLEKLSLPNVEIIGGEFMGESNSLKEIELPNVKSIGPYFLWNNFVIEKIVLPSNDFLSCLPHIKQLKEIVTIEEEKKKII